MEKIFYTRDEAAEILGMRKTAIRDLGRTHSIYAPSNQNGPFGHCRFHRAHIELIARVLIGGLTEGEALALWEEYKAGQVIAPARRRSA